ncbi:YHS domain-containing (seleno)protein [Aurantibacillus circumpalustris]|uniref:YHS domain-containing (seleno)protein n=1 Tax=Aurantibacillus circumpalustris TaxID=3036359 RepID=UPI00295C0B2D|nr:YHS domain-containing (seleno)protein [Aurantibacillus circumpalustris]
MKNKILIQLFSPFVFVWLLNAQASPSETNLRTKHYNIEKSGLAIKGYDPISYFLGNPKKGSTAVVYKYNGLTYKFTSDKNKELFSASPEKFEPAYGGWCAYAMGASGEKVEIDPETFKIINGKLYLFYNAFFNNTLPKWNANEKNLNKKADDNWKTLYK